LTMILLEDRCHFSGSWSSSCLTRRAGSLNRFGASVPPPILARLALKRPRFASYSCPLINNERR
jgi:hypothetical protein